MSESLGLSPRWAAVLGGLVVLFFALHASTITTSRLPWFDDTCLLWEWDPDLEAELLGPNGFAVASSTCAADDECGTGRQETLHVTPSVAGTGASRCLRSRTSGSGSSKRSRTTVVASSAVMPPTGTPEIVTPGAMSEGRGAVVVVPVVVPGLPKPAALTPPARTTEASAPAAAHASAKTA